ncbi:amino acid ABC transporter permease [Alterinioella nitratireducens]|jgi:polar amino acid transport system permease protein|uniref:amino acid ABC transporter permease n=1 Tax=Alterinioella nitratireducens TaxID=2735915 RepID=UPI000C9246D6|nr:amino acid ABC transporter permease [Alterinioella nitratireducens]MAN15847.1 amino acid ABC transporter permease [Dinoroseobacter sp.]NPD18454.1 amino acid ABC transporter permease [Alterinioella nitratireducens]
MSKASREAAGRWRLPALLAGVLTLLAGCSVGSGGGYTFAWYILSPSDSRGQANLSFLLKGFWATISISTLAMLISLIIGLLVALMGISKRRWVKRASRVYVEFFRSIPLLVMILWVYYGLPALTGLQLGVFMTGLVCLAISDSAFTSEIFRSGLQSIKVGQGEAARSLGLKPWTTMRLVILPQVVRAVLPALGNQYVYVLKMSSLVSVIGFQELTRRANELTLTEFRPLEIYTFLVMEYLVLILLVSWGVRVMERRMGLGVHGRD